MEIYLKPRVEYQRKLMRRRWPGCRDSLYKESNMLERRFLFLFSLFQGCFWSVRTSKFSFVQILSENRLNRVPLAIHSTSMAGLESPPILALQSIFRFLDLAERQRLRRVSKKWKFAVETMRPQRDLCIYSHSYPFEEKWSFSNEEIACEDKIYSNPSDNSSRHKVLPFMKSLERLYLYWVHESLRFFLWNLPLLNKLKVLIIRDQFFFRDVYKHFKLLSSRSLEKLSITFTGRTGVKLELDTPSLHSLVVWENRYHFDCRFRYPLKIQYLQCVDFNSMLCVCKNVEELVCQKISFPFDLNEFEFLQKVNIYPLQRDRHDTLNRLTEQRDRLHRESLQILVSGFDCCRIYYRNVDPQILLDDYYNLKVLAVNQSKLIEPIPWNCFFQFEPLYEVFGKKPKDLLKIFARIQRVEMGTEDQKLVGLKASDVVNFLVEIKVAELNLEDYYFKREREFYELLPAVRSIKELRIAQRSLDCQDYANIAKLNNLNRIKICSQKLSIEFVRKCLNLKFFERFWFKSEGWRTEFNIEIFYESDGKWYKLEGRFETVEKFVETEFNKIDELIERIVSLENPEFSFLIS